MDVKMLSNLFILVVITLLYPFNHNGELDQDFLPDTETDRITEIFVETDDCMLYRRGPRRSENPISDIQFRCSDIDEMTPFIENSGSYIIASTDYKWDPYLDVEYCPYPDYSEDPYGKVREIFESLPLHRLNISGVRVHPACGVIPIEMLDQWQLLGTKQAIVHTSMVQNLLYGQERGMDTYEFKPDIEQSEFEELIVEKIDDCMLYISIKLESIYLVIDMQHTTDMNFKCSDFDEINVLSAQWISYDFDVENRNEGRHMYVSYCKNDGKIISSLQEKFRSLPLHRLNISKIEVYPDCKTISSEFWSAFWLLREQGILVGPSIIDESIFTVNVEDTTGQRILVHLENCMLYEHMQSENTFSDIDIKFKCSGINEVNVFTTQPGQYFMEIENIPKGRFLSIAYCSNGGETFDKVQESFESLPLDRLNISGVEVYPACGVVPKSTRSMWIEFLEERAMHARVPGARTEGAVGRIPIEVGGCMIYERLRPGSVPSIMDVKFKCFNMDEVHLFSEELGFYLIEVRRYGNREYNMKVIYCPTSSENHSETELRFLSLPLHRLNISKVDLYPVC